MFVSLSAGRLLKTISSDPSGMGPEGSGQLVVTILPSPGIAQNWPSLVASAFFACVAMMVAGGGGVRRDVLMVKKKKKKKGGAGWSKSCTLARFVFIFLNVKF